MNKISRRDFLKVAAVAGGAAALAACGGTAAGSTASASGYTLDTSKTYKLEMMTHKQEIVDILQKVCDLFTKDYPNITVEVNHPSDFETSTQTRFASKDFPDIWTCAYGTSWYDYYKAGYFVDLSKEDWLKSSYSESYLTMMTFDDVGTVGIPYVNNAYGIYYNTDLFKKYNISIPTTQDELWKACDTLKSNGVLPFIFTDYDAWTTMNTFDRLLPLYGGGPFNTLMEKVASGKTASCYDDTNWRGCCELFLKMRTYGNDNSAAQEYNDGIAKFANGSCAMFPNGTWMNSLVKAANPNMNFSAFVFPGVKASDTVIATSIDLAISACAGTGKEAAEVTFLKWLSQSANAQKFADLEGSVNLVTGVKNVNPVLNCFADMVSQNKTTSYGLNKNTYKAGLASPDPVAGAGIRQYKGCQGFLHKSRCGCQNDL
jgi:raffinose/stachyose/melibiose transport system substrate-binding protein